jgi:hypothetical protein
VFLGFAMPFLKRRDINEQVTCVPLPLCIYLCIGKVSQQYLRYDAHNCE